MLLTGLIIFCQTSLSSPLEGEFEAVTLEADQAPFEVEFFFDKTGLPQGGIILSFDNHNSYLAKKLAYVLSQYGWSVVTINLSTLLATPERTRLPIANVTASKTLSTDGQTEDGETTADTAEAESETENKDAETLEKEQTATVTLPDDTPVSNRSPDYSSQLIQSSASARLDAVVDFIERKKGQLNLVFLALNQSWKQVSECTQSHQHRMKNVHGMILLDVIDSAGLTDLPADMPILDINTRRLPPGTFSLRKTSSQRYKLKRYQQVDLRTSHWQYRLKEEKLAKRIRGWLSINVKGMEVDKKSSF